MENKTIRQIIEEAMPDVELSTSPLPSADTVAPTVKSSPSQSELRKKYLRGELSTPNPSSSSLEELKRKYLGADANLELATEPVADTNENEEEAIEVKRVQSKRKSADPAENPGPRTVIVSKRKGIIGAQG